MDIGNLGMSAAATVLVLAVIPLLSLLQQRLSGRNVSGRWPGIVYIAAVGALVTVVGFSLGVGRIPPLLFAPFVALGALFAVIASSPIVSSSARRLPTLLFSASSTAFVFVPVSIIAFGSTFDPFGTGLGVIDLGGSLPALVAAGAAGLGVVWVERGSQDVAGGRAGSRSVLWPALALWGVWIGWLVGFELVIDEATPLILTNAVLMPVAGASASALVERLKRRSNTTTGLVTGLLAGLAAATPACAYLLPPLAILTALLAGAVCALLPRDGAHSGMNIVLGTCLVAASLGGVLLGALATNLGYIYTGQPEVLLGQLLSVVVTATLAFVVGAGLWAALRRIRRSDPVFN